MNWKETLTFPPEVPISDKAKDLILRCQPYGFPVNRVLIFLSGRLCCVPLTGCFTWKKTLMVVTTAYSVTHVHQVLNSLVEYICLSEAIYWSPDWTILKRSSHVNAAGLAKKECFCSLFVCELIVEATSSFCQSYLLTIAMVLTLYALEHTNVSQCMLTLALSRIFSTTYLFSGQKYKCLAF